MSTTTHLFLPVRRARLRQALKDLEPIQTTSSLSTSAFFFLDKPGICKAASPARIGRSAFLSCVLHVQRKVIHPTSGCHRYSRKCPDCDLACIGPSHEKRTKMGALVLLPANNNIFHMNF